MRGVNRVILAGTLGADPESRTFNSGSVQTRIRLATSKRWKRRDTGEPAERTEWHTVIFWGRTAETAAQYLRKGSKVFVEGELQTRKWTDRDGVERWSTEVSAQELQFLSDRGAATDPASPETTGGPYGDDDIPF